MNWAALWHLCWVLLIIDGVYASEEEPSARRVTSTPPKVRRPLRPNNIRNTIKKAVENDFKPENDPSTTSSGISDYYKVTATSRNVSNSADYLAKNTVPVASVTESARKSPKLRPPPDHLLAYQALSTTEKGGNGESINSATGWAAAGPSKNSTPKRVSAFLTPKPFNTYWSTRLHKIKATSPLTPVDVTASTGNILKNRTRLATPTENFIQNDGETYNASSNIQFANNVKPNNRFAATTVRPSNAVTRESLYSKVGNFTENQPISYASNSIPIIGSNLLKEVHGGDLGSSILNGVLATSVYNYIEKNLDDDHSEVTKAVISSLEKSRTTTANPRENTPSNITTEPTVSSTTVSLSNETSSTTPLQSNGSTVTAKLTTPRSDVTTIEHETTSVSSAVTVPSRSTEKSEEAEVNLSSSTDASIANETSTSSSELYDVDVSPTLLETSSLLSESPAYSSTNATAELSSSVVTSSESQSSTSSYSPAETTTSSPTPASNVYWDTETSSTVTSKPNFTSTVAQSDPPVVGTVPVTTVAASTVVSAASTAATTTTVATSKAATTTTASTTAAVATSKAATTTTTAATTTTATAGAATNLSSAAAIKTAATTRTTTATPTTTANPPITLPQEANDVLEAIVTKPIAKLNYSTEPEKSKDATSTAKIPINSSTETVDGSPQNLARPTEPLLTVNVTQTSENNLHSVTDQTTLESTTRHVELEENRIFPGPTTTLKPSTVKIVKQNYDYKHNVTTLSAEDEVNVSENPLKNVTEGTAVLVTSSVETTTAISIGTASTARNNNTANVFDVDDKSEIEEEDTLKYNVTVNNLDKINATDADEHNDYDHNDKDDDDDEVQTTTTFIVIEEITTTKRPTTTTKEAPSAESNPNTSRYPTDDTSEPRLRLTFQASFKEMCLVKDSLPESISAFLSSVAMRPIRYSQVKVLNLEDSECSSKALHVSEKVPVIVQITDARGKGDHNLTDALYSHLKQNRFDFKYQLTSIELGSRPVLPDDGSTWGPTVIAAIVVSSVAGVSLLCLTVLLIIMRTRQKGFTYGQRCTPVSLEDYSLDNVSVFNSVRRKAMRASKRSYGNPAFDDPVTVTNPLNFAGLSSMANSHSKIDIEYSEVPTVTVKPDELPLGVESKNRYANVIPIPETRVPLRGPDGEDVFINANFVKGAKGVEKFYIACQAPLENTIADFWTMIWEQQAQVVLMLTDLHENGVEKCADYLPPSEVLDCHRVFGDLQVTLKKREVRERYVISSIQLKNLKSNLWREVIHLWYTSWPIRGVPEDLTSIIAYLIEARSYTRPGHPIVVHCSPGTGRTGTVIAIDTAIRDFETDRIVDIPKTVYGIRRDRAGAVQTNLQYYLIYQVIHLYATKLTGGGLDSI